MNARLTVALLAGVMTLSGCANLGSIGRSTELPGEGEKAGRAIHLDAKQRLAFSKAIGIVCAEPSPDALSAYASSIGAGLSIPAEGAASVAQAFQETAASIGLRTQSITLMRDTLYRVCEAYYNRALNGAQVMQLLSQSQDLTLAILAIEQLTGAIAARQVALGGAAGAAASSNLANIQGLLDNARQNEQKKATLLKDAEQDRDKKKAAFDEKEKAFTDANKPEAKTPDAEKQKLQNARDAASRDLDLAQKKVDTAKAIANEAKNTVEAIEKNYNAALTAASATASGSGVFANAVQPVTLDQKATEHVTTAVKEIVKAVVGKSYVVDACMALITRNEPEGMDEQETKEYRRTVRFCRATVFRLSTPEAKTVGGK